MKNTLLGKRCLIILFAMFFSISSYALKVGNIDLDFFSDKGESNLFGDNDDDDGDHDDDDCDKDDDDSKGCSAKKLLKIDKKTGLAKHITLCKLSNCPNVGATSDCKQTKKLDKYLSKGYFLQSTYYLDADGDGFGNPGSSVVACVKPEGYVENNTDCNDNPQGGSSQFPGNTELCDNIDNNCSGDLNDAELGVGQSCNNGENGVCLRTGTKVCDAATLLATCNAPSGQNSITAETCLNSNADNNCDGTVDNINTLGDACQTATANACGEYGTGTKQCNGSELPVCNAVLPSEGDSVSVNYYIDADNDGAYVLLSSYAGLVCNQVVPSGTELTVNTNGDNTVIDCNDNNSSINPQASEVCPANGGEGVDENCSLSDGPNNDGVDEDCQVSTSACPCDLDPVTGVYNGKFTNAVNNIADLVSATPTPYISNYCDFQLDGRLPRNIRSANGTTSDFLKYSRVFSRWDQSSGGRFGPPRLSGSCNVIDNISEPNVNIRIYYSSDRSIFLQEYNGCTEIVNRILGNGDDPDTMVSDDCLLE